MFVYLICTAEGYAPAIRGEINKESTVKTERCVSYLRGWYVVDLLVILMQSMIGHTLTHRVQPVQSSVT